MSSDAPKYRNSFNQFLSIINVKLKLVDVGNVSAWYASVCQHFSCSQNKREGYEKMMKNKRETLPYLNLMISPNTEGLVRLT